MYKIIHFKPKFFCLFFLFTLALLFQASFSYALEVSLPGLGSNPTLPEYAAYLFNWAVGISVILAAIVIAYGGIYWLVSFGLGKFTSEGKEWVKNGILGLLIVMSAYLIAWTINPDLVVFKLNGLPLINISPTSSDNSTQDQSSLGYQEIPIGSLVEKVLSGDMDCYDYDSKGDPMPVERKTDAGKTIQGPTYLDHDRTDCLLKIAKAVELKSKIATALSKKIAKLMDECECFGACGDSCTSKTPCPPYSGGMCNDNTLIFRGSEKLCENNCKNSPCKCTGKDCDPCPEEIRDKIEGKTAIGLSVSDFPDTLTDICPEDKVCSYAGLSYKGLEEFRTSKTESDISGLLEQSATINDKSVTYVDMKAWSSLKLIEQLMYLKQKADEIRKDVKGDLLRLQSAESSLKDCYLSTPYSDFLGVAKQNKTANVGDISQYCAGFAYNNSQCYSQCQKMCPGDTSDDFDLYQGCKSCSGKTGKEKEKCLTEMQNCMKKKYDKRTCPYSDTYKNFDECMQGCKNQCINLCQRQYIGCSDQMKQCVEKCNSDSKCLIDNESACIMDFEKLQQCVDEDACKSACSGEGEEACKQACENNSSSKDYVKMCVNNAYLCKNCSDQYAGYPECLKENSGSDEYSSSYLWQNQGEQQCPACYPCSETFPDSQTQKCPSCSKCPNCPCDITTTQAVTESEEGEQTCSETKSYRVCSTDCNEYKYNDDPLTFYCQNSWWLNEKEKNTIPLGENLKCPLQSEIPVGKTVDDTEAWAGSFADKIKGFVKKTQELIDYLKKIGDEKDYCQCDSKCEGGEPICHTKCIFDQFWIQNDENPFLGGKWVCVCGTVPCSGKSCQKIINWLVGKSAAAACSVGISNPGVEQKSTQVSNELTKIKDFLASQTVSDIVKELNYSREQVNRCGVVQTSSEKQVKLLSCQRVIDNLAPEIKNSGYYIIADGQKVYDYCYGQQLSLDTSNSDSMMDNWFCCENYSDPTQK